MKEGFISTETIKTREVLTEETPYVVSGDIYTLMKTWASENGFTLPQPEFFAQLRTNFVSSLEEIFPAVEFVEENVLSAGINELVRESGLPAITLDRVYCDSDARIDLTRLVGLDGRDSGLGRRGNTPPLLRQIKDLRSLGYKEAALVDDVIFTGGVAQRVSEALETAGIKVAVIIAGIAIGEGQNKLTDGGREVRSVKSWKNVIDQVCERDYYPGVPYSGRLIDNNNDIGAPYVLPFGNPGKWASIPEELQIPFSDFCLYQAEQLFKGIEYASGRSVKCQDIGRNIIGVPQDETRFADVLRVSRQAIQPML